jgi:hypothetical protein
MTAERKDTSNHVGMRTDGEGEVVGILPAPELQNPSGACKDVLNFTDFAVHKIPVRQYT